MPNPDWLRYFVTLAETLNFSAAAERLHLTPQALSKAISGLEDHFGQRLVDRDHRVKSLTPAGEVLNERARSILAALDDIERVLAEGLDTEPAGPVRIGAVGVWHNMLLPIALARLLPRHPRILPRVHEMLPDDAERWVAAGEIDLGFLLSPPARPGIDARAIARTPYVIVGSPQPRRHWSELGYVVPRFFRTELARPLDGWFDDRFPRRIVAEVEMLETAVQLLEAGVGAAFVPLLAVRERLERGTLAIVADPPVAIEERLYLATRQGVRATLATRELVAALEDAARETNDP